MALQQMHNVGIVVGDLDAAIAFFAELGMEREGEALLEGSWVDSVIGLEGVSCDIVMMRTPDGEGRIELTRFRSPAAVAGEPADAPANMLGIRRIMFGVDDLDDTLARLRTRGGEVVGEVVQYEDVYRLCYVRGPDGVLIGVAEELG